MNMLTGAGQSGFSPEDLPGLAAWYEADDLALSDGQAVALWPDNSGNGRDIQQGSAPDRPIYRANQLNGRGAVDFDGVSQFLVSAAVAIVQPFTVFMAVEFDAAFGGFTSLCGWGGGVLGRIDQTTIQTYSGAFGAYVGVSNTEDPHIYAAEFNGASSKMWADGTAGTTADSGAVQASGICLGANFGAGQFSNCRIYEYLMFSGQLAAGHRQSVERYLGNRLGLAMA